MPPSASCVHRPVGHYEEVELTETSVNPGPERIGPHCFELLRVLGKGGYGKVGAPPPSSLASQQRLLQTNRPVNQESPGRDSETEALGGKGRSSQSQTRSFLPRPWAGVSLWVPSVRVGASQRRGVEREVDPVSPALQVFQVRKVQGTNLGKIYAMKVLRKVSHPFSRRIFTEWPPFQMHCARFGEDSEHDGGDSLRLGRLPVCCRR